MKKSEWQEVAHAKKNLKGWKVPKKVSEKFIV